MNKELAKIESFKLNISDRGILMFYIFVKYESGCSQGVGGMCLDEYDKETKTRVGTAYGCEMIRQLMLTLKVDDFSDAKDKLIYVLGEGEGFSFKPLGIQTLDVYGDVKTMIFDEVYQKFAAEGEKSDTA